tara:strand:+ start:775 stop:912 length:138 start_codon:yes stop_codon:yes gene_type:complete
MSRDSIINKTMTAFKAVNFLKISLTRENKVSKVPFHSINFDVYEN